MHYFIILAFNEEENLPRLAATIPPVAKDLPGGYRIIIVDDGSTDRTQRVIEQLSGSLPIQVERHEKNKGVAQGFRTGFNAALQRAKKGDVIFTLEADNTVDLALLPGMARRIQDGPGVVLGSCYMRGGSVSGVPFLRKLMSQGINLFMRVAFPIEHCHTYSSFFRAYSYGALRLAMDTYGTRFIESEGFTVAAEILFKLRRIGVRMDEVPMHLRFGERSGNSKMKVGRTIIEYIRFLWREMKSERSFARGRS
jgi:dolichol-phosphate mannosyltransferase